MQVQEMNRLKWLLRSFLKRQYKNSRNLHFKDVIAFADLDRGQDDELPELLREFKESFPHKTNGNTYDTYWDVVKAVDEEIKDRIRSISISEIQTLKRCSLQHALKYHGRYYKKDEDKTYFRIGSWTHELIETLYKQFGYDGAEESGDEKVKGYMKDLVGIWAQEAKQEVDDKKTLDQIEIDSAIAYGCFVSYYEEGFKKEREKGYELQTDNSEKFFETHVKTKSGRKSPRYRFRGFMDSLYVGNDNNYYLGEVKTKSSWGDSGRKHLELDEQITGYCWALHQQRIDVAGVIYTVLKKPGIKPKLITHHVVSEEDGEFFYSSRIKCKAKDEYDKAVKMGLNVNLTSEKRRETASEYAERVRQDYESRPEFYFYRDTVFRSTDQVKAFGKKVRVYSKRAAQNTIDEAFPEPADAFNNYCNFCDYRQLCVNWHDKPLREELLKANFTTPRERAVAEIVDTSENDQLLGTF